MVTVESCGGHSYRDIRPHGGADGDDGSEDPGWSVVVDVEVLTEPNIHETLVQSTSSR